MVTVAEGRSCCPPDKYAYVCACVYIGAVCHPNEIDRKVLLIVQAGDHDVSIMIR